MTAFPQASDARTEEDREWATETLARRMDLPVTVLGIIFVLLVLAETMARGEAVRNALAVASWALWGVFAAEFGLRFAIAPSKGRFLKRHWWQLAFLVVPFLRFVRAAAVLRTLRIGRVLSSAVRGSRSAARLLSSRIGWLAAVTVIVVLAASQLLYGFGDYVQYSDALYDAALATVAGTATGQPSPVARILDVALAVYSVVVFAALAASLGAYFLEREGEQRGVLRG